MTFKTTIASVQKQLSQIKGKFYLLAPQMVLAAALFCVCFTTNAHASSQVDIVGPVGSSSFGFRVQPLPNGNIVILDPNFDAPGPILNVGAIYLYNGTTLALISVMTGSKANDNVGVNLTVLPSGNFVVNSRGWDNGSAINAGAVTWCSGTIGCSGAVSAANSLVGSTGDDTAIDVVYILANGNYVINSPLWDGSAVDFGAVTWCSGTTGCSGLISTSNSLVGSKTGGLLSNQSITALTNGNYVVNSKNWSVTTAAVGAVTWCDGSSSTVGTISAANSMVGSTANDRIGFPGGVVPLTNGNYVFVSTSWDGAAVDAGAATWGNGTIGTTGVVSSANSLVGSSLNDNVGSPGVTALTNGNYIVRTTLWDGVAADVGAVTWGNGSTGISGVVSSVNSLVGSTATDNIGSGGAKALTNGNYIFASPIWDGAAADVGAVTWGNGATGTTGVVSSSNSLVGSTASDKVGGTSSEISALTNGNYVVNSLMWDGAAVDIGAVTFCDGSTGRTGPVTTANSMVGSTAGDNVGSRGTTPLTNGNYIFGSPNWDGVAVNVGAVTWGNGMTGATGVVSQSNSFVGSTAGDQIGNLLGNLNTTNAVALTNGNYFIVSPNWDSTAIDVGAITWGNGATGTSGVISSANSLVGSTANDKAGFCDTTGFGSCPPNVVVLPNGDFYVNSTDWDNGGIVNAGAVSYVSGTGGTVGTINANNSFLGQGTNHGKEVAAAFNSFNQTLVVGSPLRNIVTIFTPDRATAAGVSISGRVKTTEGRGVRNARVVLTDQNGQRRSVITSARGYYHFDEVEAGQNVILSVMSRRFQFDPRVIDVSDNLTDIDFFPNP